MPFYENQIENASEALNRLCVLAARYDSKQRVDSMRIRPHYSIANGTTPLSTDRALFGGLGCKIACNNDPLRGCFASNNDPPLTLCVSVLPFGPDRPGRSDGGWLAWTRSARSERDQARLFRSDRVQVCSGHSANAEARRLGRGADEDPGSGIQAAQARTPLDAAAFRGTAWAWL
jgi:hypothetical protein